DMTYRPFYEELFVKLATRLAELQCPDGYWHASLLDPDSYPSPETSATGFIVYGLAYGINNGYLSAEAYLPVVEKGWKALTAAVESDGKLGWVQPVGADPRKVTRDMTELYGTGAFLMAACEMYQLVK
ncbi:glycoside hydrolase family 88 protein, partial [Parabacteroides sp. OttesenSCG-928-J18]|nr:glycoside hydrolase family 88 protein [Parabacteroides sp. OttesenSCG-928-J18]